MFFSASLFFQIAKLNAICLLFLVFSPKFWKLESMNLGAATPSRIFEYQLKL